MSISQINLNQALVQEQKPVVLNGIGLNDLGNVIKAESRQLQRLPENLEIRSKIPSENGNTNYLASYRGLPLIISFEKPKGTVPNSSDNFEFSSPKVLQMDPKTDADVKRILDENLPKANTDLPRGNIEVINKALKNEIGIEIKDPNLAQKITNSLIDKRLESAKSSETPVNYAKLVQEPISRGEIVQNLDTIKEILEANPTMKNTDSRSTARTLAKVQDLF